MSAASYEELAAAGLGTAEYRTHHPDVPMLEVHSDSPTSLLARPHWLPLRPASAEEIALGAEHPEFWLDDCGDAYYALMARRVSHRAARVRQP